MAPFRTSRPFFVMSAHKGEAEVIEKAPTLGHCRVRSAVVQQDFRHRCGRVVPVSIRAGAAA
jgi:hypothetical protein